MANGKAASFVWTIECFDMCPHLHGERLYSPEFKIGSYVFCLYLFPRGWKDSKYVSVFIKRLDDCGEPEIRVKAKICLIGGSQHSEYYHRSCDENFKNMDRWGFDWIKRDIILTNERARFLPNNKLTIRCDLLSLCEYVENSNTFNDDNDAENLSSDFDALLSSGICSDMVLIINENKFKVHKFLLNCRCPKIMSHLKETKIPDEYTLSDIEAPVLRLLLRYLYTGTFKVSNLYEEILIASDAFSIPHVGYLLTFPYCKVISGTTEIVTSKLSFKWVIKSFSRLPVNEELVYPAFYATCDEWSKLKVILTVVKHKRSSRVELKFRKLASNKVDFIRCKISVANTNLITTVKEYEHTFASGEKDWLTPFGSEIELSHILLHDTLNACFEISMSKNESNSKIKKVVVTPKTREAGKIDVIKNLKLLQKDLASLFDNGSNSGDITLRVGDVEYSVHKFIMCARSPVFAKMFEYDTLEKKDGVVIIEDIDAQTVLSMLRYIYSGYLDEMEISDAIKLYAAADKYELLTLRNACSKILKDSVNADNIWEISLLADAHHDRELKSCVSWKIHISMTT